MLKPALMLAAFAAFISIIAIPWAIPFPGRGTLTGDWVGELRSSRGPRAWLYLHLEVNSDYNSPRIGDRAAVCTNRRRIDLDVNGYTTSWSGKTIALLLQPRVPSPPALRFEMEGSWSGDTLQVRQADRSIAETLNEPDDRPAVESEGSQWIAATLTRGMPSEFDSACAALAGRQ
jgi:hypothetical protein